MVTVGKARDSHWVQLRLEHVQSIGCRAAHTVAATLESGLARVAT